MNPRKAVCILAAFVIAFVPLALGQGTYTQIDVPGATTTVIQGINAAGDVVGSYNDSNGSHGFLLSSGVFTTIDYPGPPGFGTALAPPLVFLTTFRRKHLQTWFIRPLSTPFLSP